MALPAGYLTTAKTAAAKDAIRRGHYTAAKTSVTLRHVRALPASLTAYPYDVPAAAAGTVDIVFRASMRTEKDKAELEIIGEVIGADLIVRIWREEIAAPDPDLNPHLAALDPPVAISTRETDIDALTKDEVLFDGAAYQVERARLAVQFFDGTFLFVVLFLRRKNRSGK